MSFLLGTIILGLTLMLGETLRPRLQTKLISVLKNGLEEVCSQLEDIYHCRGLIPLTEWELEKIKKECAEEQEQYRQKHNLPPTKITFAELVNSNIYNPPFRSFNELFMIEKIPQAENKTMSDYRLERHIENQKIGLK